MSPAANIYRRKKRRILVCGLFHEGHSFSNYRPTLPDFPVVRGEELLLKARASASGLGGAVRTLEAAGQDVVPGLSVVIPPSGPLRDGDYAHLKEEIVAGAVAAGADGVVVDLHGAMLTESLDDADGDLLRCLRGALRDVPIAVTLDLHAHMTATMLENATVCLACKENPHTDFAEAGARAARLLLRTLENEIRPATAAAWVPLIIGARMETGSGPLAELHRARRNYEQLRDDVYDVSIYNTTAYLDAKGAGQCITATGASADAMREIAAELAQQLWQHRDEFESDRLDLDQVLVEIARSTPLERPYVIGDHGDRVLAGAAGDDTQILRAISTRWPQLRALVPITDPHAVKAAASVGVGAEFRFAIGGIYSRNARPFEATWRVRHLGDGRFVQRGPFLAGEPTSLGATAVLESGCLTVLATSLPGMTQDPAAFTVNRIGLDAYDLIVSKSGYHFKISFADIGHCVVVDTPGLSNYRPGFFPYAKRRPIYPEDPIGANGLSIKVELF